MGREREWSDSECLLGLEMDESIAWGQQKKKGVRKCPGFFAKWQDRVVMKHTGESCKNSRVRETGSSVLNVVRGRASLA